MCIIVCHEVVPWENYKYAIPVYRVNINCYRNITQISVLFSTICKYIYKDHHDAVWQKTVLAILATSCMLLFCFFQSSFFRFLKKTKQLMVG